MTGYRKVMNFTEESITGAGAALERIKAGWRAAPAHAADDTLLLRVEAALDDDSNTSQATAEIFASLGGPNQTSRATLLRILDVLGLTPHQTWDEEPARSFPENFIECLSPEISHLTFNGADPAGAVDKVIALRARARAQRDWKESDRLRDALLRCGVALQDSREGTTWSIAE